MSCQFSGYDMLRAARRRFLGTGRVSRLVLLVVLTGTTAFLPKPVVAGEPTARLIHEWGAKGEAPGEFSSPIGIACTPGDQLVVTDLNNARVQVFSTEGTPQGGFDLVRDKPERKSTVVGGIAIDAEGLIYLSFMVQHKIAVFRQSGELVREWGGPGAEPGQMQQPGGMIWLDAETLLVCDQCNHRLQKFTREGKLLGVWGGYGSKAGEFGGANSRGSRFGGPHFVARDSQGRLYTTEGTQGRIQVLTGDGAALRQWGEKGDGPGGFGDYRFGNQTETMGPISIAVDRHDRVLVSSLNDRVQAFTPDGKYLFAITGNGRDDDALLHPHGMAFDRSGALYLCDSGNQRILKFELPVP